MRQPSMSVSSASAGQSPALIARVNEKKAELENLRELRDLSAAVASQMEALEEKLATLSDGTEAIAHVVGSWQNVLRAINMASSKLASSALPETLVRIPTEHAPTLQAQAEAQAAEAIEGEKRPGETVDERMESLNYLDIDTRFSIDRLTEELEHFHLHSPSKENICDKSADPLQQPETRPGQANPSFAVTANAGGPGRPALVSTAHDPPRVPVHELATNEEQLAKHTAATRLDLAGLCGRDSTRADAADTMAATTEAQRISVTALADALKTPQASMNAALAQTDSAGKRASLKTGAKTVRAKATVGRALLVRQSTSTTLAKDGEKESWTSPGPRKRTAPAPPASLLPPKPLAKSNRPPIKPTFELPGEAVARRLKEQREARLSQPISADEAAAVAAKYSPSKPHAKSTKVPTRPTFELPGEAISRRKREEHEAKLRAQEEEDRKRREFKARPVRTSIAPSTFPRGTIASRARQGKVQAEGSEAAAAAVAATSFTRLSIATTSSSTGGEPRSTVSAEEAQQQKQRGRAVFSRDNSYAANRERERRQREAAAKQARQDAAERSRRLSREWAEKQRLRKLAAAGGEAS
ncbi:hypothetical protein P8C59_005200 [Phyllachora maydis]|uniref:DASH complex subunit DAD2 n=1 Tax=Phyllachora maydis TaxID=1825666 RepID=A0AAD9MF96_9PEZI|nr:hypothetical protein P8C59_005200 [Phyllachora maydis]